MELSTALSYTAAVANQSNVSLDKMIAMIGVVSSVTRASAETIGQAFKTILVRMQAVAANKSVDEFGEDINNVEKTLRKAGIEIRATATTFKPMGDVLDEVGKKWETFGTTQQEQIAGALGGMRQANTLLTLFQNYGDVAKYVTAETDSAGLAMKNYEVYLKGVEAAQNRATASWEKLAQSTVSSGVVAGAYDFLSLILNITDAIGGVPVILLTVGAAYLAFSTTIVAGSSVALLSVASLEAAFTALLATNPLGWAVLAVGAIVMIANAIPTAQEKIEKLNASIVESNSKIAGLRDSAKSINEMSAEYEELSKKTNRTKEESQKLLDVQNKLKESVPTLTGHFDAYGNFILDASNDMNSLTDATYAQIESEKKLRQAKIDESASGSAQLLMEAQKRKIGLGAKGGSLYSESEKIKVNLDWANALADSKSAFSEMGDDAQKSFIASLNSPELVKIFTDLKNQLSGDLSRSAESDRYSGLAGLFGTKEDAVQVGADVATSVYAGFSETLKGLADSSSVIDDLISKSNSAEGLSIADAAKIPPEYLDSLTVVGDKLTVNIDLLKQTQLEQAGTALSAIQSAAEVGDATAQQVAVVQMQYNQLLADSQSSYGAFSQTAWDYDALLWQISNDAIAAGYNAFTNTEGNALSSAQSIHDYMASSDAAFNNFVQQAANATGQSVVQVMNTANAMATQSYNNTVALINSLKGMSTFGMPQNIGSLIQAASPSQMSMPNIFSTPNTSRSGGGGGGGGGNSQSSSNSQAEQRQRELENQIADARKNAIDDLKEQLSLYKDITDEKKKALDIASDERQYAQDVEDKNKEILKVQTELNALQFDNSQEANARRLELQDQLNNLNQDLSDINYNQSVDVQKNALDADYAALQAQIDSAIKAVGDISADSLSSFTSQLATILQGISIPTPSFHSGAEKGVIGNGTSLKSGEVFAKMMAGEVVSNAGQIDNFMTKTLPQMVQGNSTMNGGNIELNMPISIGGSLDRSTLPDLKKIVEAAVEQINKNMMNRGFNRRAEMFGN